MKLNKLQFNDDKTKYLIVVTPEQSKKVQLPPLNIDGTEIHPSEYAMNLGVIFDRHLNMKKRVDQIMQKAYFHLREIGRIRKSLSMETTKTIMHALVTSTFDYCNVLLNGISGDLIKKLQRIQNTAARMICKKGKFDHITPVLMELHWLQIRKIIAI